MGPIQPPIQLLPGAISARVKRQGREAHYLPQSSTKVKNGGAIPQFPRTSFYILDVTSCTAVEVQRRFGGTY
jgi:hypothetical protein